MNKSTKYWIFLPLLLMAVNAGCSGNEKSDAYGQFEATDVVVSSEASGKLKQYNVEEGMRLREGQYVGAVDTSQMVLRREQLRAKMKATYSRIDQLNAEAGVLREQIAVARKDLNRFIAMQKDSAATPKQIDDVQGQIDVLQQKIRSTEVQKQSVRAEVKATQAQIAEVEDQISKARIVNPVNGRVLVKYTEPGEVVRYGQSLYKIANLDTLELRAFVSGGQLSHFRLGDRVQVLVDENSEEMNALSGRISWISDEAEFTPKMIQTKEERVTQVYAFKVRVPNDGSLKIGMPGEVNFNAQ